MPRYEFIEGKSNKFWEINLDGNSVVTHYGRIGSSGQTTTKSFPDEAKARAAYERLVREKSNKGYTLKGNQERISLPAKESTTLSIKDQAFDSDALYLVRDGSYDLWMSYGPYLVNGYARRVAGTLELVRTGPYAPALSFLFSGEVLVNDRLSKALNEASLTGVKLKKAIKKKIVSIAWHTWDLKAKEPKVWPRRHEPDLYFDRKHDPLAAKALGNFFELVVNNDATIEGPDDGTKTVTVSNNHADVIGAKQGYHQRLVVTAKARKAIEPFVDKWIKFEPLHVDRPKTLPKKSAPTPVIKSDSSASSGSTLPEPKLRISGAKDEVIYDFAFSPDGRQIAVQLGNWRVEIWDLVSAKRISDDAFRGPSGKDKPAQLAESPGSAGIALNSGTLFGLKGMSRKTLFSKKPGALGCTVTELGPKDAGYGAFSPDQKYLVWPTGKSLTTIDLATKKLRSVPWTGLPDWFQPVVSRNASHVALIMSEFICWVDTSTGKELWRHTTPSKLSSVFMLDTRRLCVAGKTGWQVIDIKDGSIYAAIDLDSKLQINRCTRLGGDRILVAYQDQQQSLAIWDCRSKTPVRIFELDSGGGAHIDELNADFDAKWTAAVVNYENLLIWPASAFDIPK